MHIFVSIASYRDPCLHLTLKSLIQNKSKRHKATYSVFEQTRLEDSLETKYPELVNNRDVVYKRIDPEYSDGCVWARSVNMLNIRDEHDFFYQIDSHILFDENWDRMLIEDYKKARDKADTDKVIISGSCKAFILNEDGSASQFHYEEPITSVVRYFTINPKTLLPGAHGDHIPATKEPTQGFHVLAGNFFTHRDWCYNVGLDPQSYYDAEEPLMTLTSYEAGYKLFHHSEMMSYHLDDTKNYPTKLHFNPVVSQDKIDAAFDRCVARWKTYLENISEDVLKSFHKDFGVDFINCVIEDRARTTSISVGHSQMSDNDIEYEKRMAKERLIGAPITNQLKYSPFIDDDDDIPIGVVGVSIMDIVPAPSDEDDSEQEQINTEEIEEIEDANTKTD